MSSEYHSECTEKCGSHVLGGGAPTGDGEKCCSCGRWGGKSSRRRSLKKEKDCRGGSGSGVVDSRQRKQHGVFSELLSMANCEGEERRSGRGPKSRPAY